MAQAAVIHRDVVIDAQTTDDAIELFRATIGYADAYEIKGSLTIKVRGKPLKEQPALPRRKG